ncbi:Uncharacterised protein [Vibrio cholerae]|nr:Uncharacterised protein [Vibrio cholerae]
MTSPSSAYYSPLIKASNPSATLPFSKIIAGTLFIGDTTFSLTNRNCRHRDFHPLNPNLLIMTSSLTM